MSFFSNLFGENKNPLDTYSKELLLVNGFKDEVASLSQEQMKQEIADFRLLITPY